MKLLSLLFCALLAGCADKNETRSNPTREVLASIQPYCAPAVAFVYENEKRANKTGRALTLDERALAAKIGIKDISRVRLLFVSTFPYPEDPLLAVIYDQTGFNSSKMAAFTYGHAIYIRNQYNRELLAHEMTHITQYEQLGVPEFIRRYLLDLTVVGYLNSPLELEAYKNGARFK